MTDNQTVAIIGYGAAGVNAAIALRNNGYEGTIKAFTNHGGLPYSPILTSYYAGGEKTLADCFPWSKEELDDLRVDVVEEPVISLDPTAHVIATSQGEHGYAKCVIASGATPSTAGFPIVAGDESYRPLVLRTMEDAARLKETLESPACKRFLVSGASMVALKILEAALNHGKECTLVGMNPHVLDFNALPETAERFENGLREKGVILRLGQTIRQVERIGERLSVTFSNGETDEFDEMPQKIEDALIEHPLIAFTYTVDVDPKSGYIVHLFSCVG